MGCNYYCRLFSYSFYRQGSYKLIESDEQFQTMQHHHRRSESEINQPSTAQRENQAPNQQQIPSRRSGYVNSGAETEVDANSQSIKRKQRRQRFVKLHLFHVILFYFLFYTLQCIEASSDYNVIQL